MKTFNWKALMTIGLVAGLVQVAAGVAMYLAGVYFASWSMLVSLLVLLVCIGLGTRSYAAKHLNGEITYLQALVVGVAVSVSTGLIYAIYNLISISFFYPHFLDDLVRVIAARSPASQQTPEAIALLRSKITAIQIAVPNLIRLSVFGSILSLFTSLILRKVRRR